MIDFCFENMITGISEFLIGNALVRSPVNLFAKLN